MVNHAELTSQLLDQLDRFHLLNALDLDQVVQLGEQHSEVCQCDRGLVDFLKLLLLLGPERVLQE